MPLHVTILAVLLGLAPSVTDTEEPHEREQRLAVAAHAIAAAAYHATCTGPWAELKCRPIWRGSPEHAAAALIALGKAESHFAEYVGEGRCLDGPVGQQCDLDPKTGHPRARSYFQLWEVAAPDLWQTEPGSTEAVRVAAWAAMRRLAGARTRCRSRAPTALAGAFSGYRGASCTWTPAAGRAASAHRIARQLHSAP